ncbi:MAG TPA: hypothetical protein ENG66_06095 [Thermococcus sp.]|nr:hypothetical protein [Thermococcus sp.]
MMRKVIRFLLGIIFFISFFTCIGCTVSLFAMFNCWLVEKLELDLIHLISGATLTFLVCGGSLLLDEVLRK